MKKLRNILVGVSMFLGSLLPTAAKAQEAVAPKEAKLVSQVGVLGSNLKTAPLIFAGPSVDIAKKKSFTNIFAGVLHHPVNHSTSGAVIVAHDRPYTKNLSFWGRVSGIFGKDNVSFSGDFLPVKANVNLGKHLNLSVGPDYAPSYNVTTSTFSHDIGALGQAVVPINDKNTIVIEGKVAKSLNNWYSTSSLSSAYTCCYLHKF